MLDTSTSIASEPELISNSLSDIIISPGIIFSIEVAVPDVKTYLRLREKSGMRPRTISGATKGLGSELFSVLLRHNESDQIVGMGRVVGDGGTVFHICDMAVEQEWQGQGGGSMIMDSLMDYITGEASGYSYIDRKSVV